MHPILAQSRRFLLYLLGWIPVAGLLIYLLVNSRELAWGEALALVLPMVLIFAFVCLSPWYLCRRLPLGSTPVTTLALHHLSAALLSTLLWVALANGFALALSQFFPDLPARIHPHPVLLFGIGVLLYEFAVASHYVFLAIQASRQAELLARDAELRALKAQINPHFLFNSLHSISALTAVDPARAREMCIRLSDFLRHTLGLGDKASIPLGEELTLVRNYLEIEQVRFGTRLRVDSRIEAGCEHIQIPPLLLQPLVENAVKHGVATLVEGGSVELVAVQKGDLLCICVENEFDPDAPSNRRNGVGLANVRRRLLARYGSGARLEIGVENNRFRAELRLPADL